VHSGTSASSSQTGKREPMKGRCTRRAGVVVLQPVEHVDRRHPGRETKRGYRYRYEDRRWPGTRNKEGAA
jgi:hypothetical protein